MIAKMEDGFNEVDKNTEEASKKCGAGKTATGVNCHNGSCVVICA